MGAYLTETINLLAEIKPGRQFPFFKSLEILPGMEMIVHSISIFIPFNVDPADILKILNVEDGGFFKIIVDDTIIKQGPLLSIAYKPLKLPTKNITLNTEDDLIPVIDLPACLFSIKGGMKHQWIIEFPKGIKLTEPTQIIPYILYSASEQSFRIYKLMTSRKGSKRKAVKKCKSLKKKNLSYLLHPHLSS